MTGKVHIVLRIFMIGAALVLGLIGLAMSLCGGGFLFSTLVAMVMNHRNTGALGVLPIALGALVIGIPLVTAAVSLFSRATRPAEDEAD